MPKSIIVCTDGTWNRPGEADPAAQDNVPADTNVCKFFTMLPGVSQPRSSSMRVKSVQGQVALYDDGVGADGLWAVRVADGATGAGLEVKLGTATGSSANNMKPGTASTCWGSVEARLPLAASREC